MKRNRVLGSGLVGLGLGAGMVGCLVVGCSPSNNPAAVATASPVSDVPAPPDGETTPKDETLAVTVEAPKRTAIEDFSMKTLDGKPWRLSGRKGKVVLLNLWATWCPPCRQETADLVALAKKYRDQGVEVVGITMDENPKKVVPGFVKEFGVPYPMLVPKGDEAVLAYAQGGIPTTVLIAKDGGVESATTGMVSPETMGEQIDLLLREKA